MATEHGIVKEYGADREAQHVQTINVQQNRPQSGRSARPQNIGGRNNRPQSGRSVRPQNIGGLNNRPQSGRSARPQNIGGLNNRPQSGRSARPQNINGRNGRPQSSRVQHARNFSMQRISMNGGRSYNRDIQYAHLKRQRQGMRRRKAALIFISMMLLLAISFSFLTYFQKKSNNDSSSFPKDIKQFFDDDMIGSAGDVQSTSNSRLSSGSVSHAVGQDYINLCALDQVDKPQVRTPKQVMERLEYLALDNDLIAEILQDSSNYPDKMLEALANNPEMADFVLGYPESDGRVLGGLTEEEMKEDFPLFLQWDPRWGYAEYGDGSNIGLAGCGPTCLSMALYYLTGDESLTPDKISAYSMKNGYYVSGTGTAWALMQDVPAKYDIGVSQPTAEEYTMKDALDRGRVIICSVGPGDFTAAGHFIVIYGYDKGGFLVNDPNCVARSRQSWSFSELKGQIKNIWVLGGELKSDFLMENDFSIVTEYSIY